MIKHYLVKETMYDGMSEYGSDYLITAEEGNERNVAIQAIEENWGVTQEDRCEADEDRHPQWDLGERIVELNRIEEVPEEDYPIIKKYIYEA